jgi:hypothetical protein
MESLGHVPKPEAVQALLRLYEESKKLKVANVKNNNQGTAEKQHENEALMLVANAIMNLNEFVTKN